MTEIRVTDRESVTETACTCIWVNYKVRHHVFKKLISNEIVQSIIAAIDLWLNDNKIVSLISCREIANIIVIFY